MNPLRDADRLGCSHGGHPCPRMWRAPAVDTRMPPVRLLNLTLSMLLLYAAIGAWVASLV